jgi:hypothetical protein
MKPRALFPRLCAPHDATLVTPVTCAFDVNFCGRSTPPSAGCARSAPPLLSLGDEECQSAVLETDDSLAPYTDKFEQRFVDKQKSA